MCWLVGALITSGGVLLAEQEIVRISKMDAWFSYLLPMIYAFGVGIVFYRLSALFPDKHLFEIAKLLAGKPLGTVINVLIMVHIWFVLIRDCRALAQFIKTILLPNTPEEVILLLFALLLLYFGTTSVEVVARVNDIFFPIFVLCVFLMPLLLGNEINAKLLGPVLTTPLSSILSSNLLGAGWYADIIAIGAFLHTVHNNKQLSVSYRHGIVIGTLLLTMFVVMEIMVFGYNMPGNMVYPNYTLVQQINITDFLDRMDLFLLSIWFPILACKIILIYLAFLTGLASFVGKREYTLFSKPAALFVTMSSLLSFKSTTEVFSFGNYSVPLYTLPYQLIVLPMLYVLARIRTETSERQAQTSGSRGAGQVSQQGTQTLRKKFMAKTINNMSFRMLYLITILLFAVCTCSIAAGLTFARQLSWVGIVCGAVYGASLLLLLANSYLEVMKAREL